MSLTLINARPRIALLLAALVTLWPARAALAQDPSAVDYLLANINAARAANGLPPYALNSLLTVAAQAHSEDMAEQAALLLSQGQDISGAVTHTGSDGSSVADRVAATGYAAIQVGEDVYATRFGPEVAFDWWMGSSLHRNNILHTHHREIGIGAAPGPEGLVMYTLVFAHGEDSPVLPAPTQPTSATPIPATPLPTSTPSATATVTVTPSPLPTSTVARIQLPPAAASSVTPTTTPGTTSGLRVFAPDVWLWVILLEVAAAAVAIYVFVRLQRR